MVCFVDRFRGEYGVEPICAVLAIASSTYREHKARQADPARRSAREQRVVVMPGRVRRVWQVNHGVYGARKVYKQLQREGVPTAKCTMRSLMRQMGLEGAVRGKGFKVTIDDDSASRPPNLVDGHSPPPAPTSGGSAACPTWRPGKTIRRVRYRRAPDASSGWRASNSLGPKLRWMLSVRRSTTPSTARRRTRSSFGRRLATSVHSPHRAAGRGGDRAVRRLGRRLVR